MSIYDIYNDLKYDMSIIEKRYFKKYKRNNKRNKS